jgi:VCBS repeat protein
MSLNLSLDFEQSALNAPQSFRDGIQTAASILEALITDPITVTIRVGYGDWNNNSDTGLTTGAEGGDLNGVYESYSALRTALAAHVTSAIDQTFLNSLPNTSSLNGLSSFYVPSADAKALGFMSSTGTAVDGAVGFGTQIPGSDLVGVALHELTHALGREPGTGPFDFARYTGLGQHLFSSQSTAPAAYFSIDGGSTKIADFGQISDPGDFLNSGVQGPADPFNEYYSNSTLQNLTAVDKELLDVLGFDVGGQQTSSAASSLPFTPASGWSTQDGYPRLLADINGDGLADIVGFGAAGTYVSLASGSGSFSTPILDLNAFGSDVGAGGWVSQLSYPRLVGDINGDGLQDVVGFSSSGVEVALGMSNGGLAAPIMAFAGFGSSPGSGGWSSQDLYPRAVADVNGDHHGDLVGFGSAGVYVAASTGAGSFHDPVLELHAFGAGADAGGWTSQNVYPRTLADINGDGAADVIGFASDGVYVALATGNGQFGTPVKVLSDFGSSPAGGGWTTQDAYPRFVADVNGDGKPDIVGFGSDGVYVSLNNGSGSFGPVFKGLSTFGSSLAGGGWVSENTYPREVADVNHDGRADIVGFGTGDVYVALGQPDGTFAAPTISLAPQHDLLL